MRRYEVKPENVEAEQFTGNWQKIVDWLGPHLTNTEEYRRDDEVHYVFDVENKEWVLVTIGDYVVRDSLGAIKVMDKSDFEKKWQPERQVFPTFPTYPGIIPGTLGVTYKSESGNS